MTQVNMLALTIDIGLSAVKVALFRRDRSLVALHEMRNSAVMHEGRSSTLDLPRLWELTRDGIAAVLLSDGISAEHVTGIGLSATGNGLYLLSPAGDPLLGITSMDTRAEATVKGWNQSPLAAQALKVTANHLWAGQPLPLLNYLKQAGTLPEDYRLLFCKDWIRYCLTGEMATDRSDASAAGLLDIQTGEWATTVFDAAGFTTLVDRLPRLVNSTEATGTVTSTAAVKTGLAEGTPVFGGGIDLALGAWADGLDAPDLLHVTAGTWSINQQLCASIERLDMDAFLQIIVSPDGGHHTVVDSSPTSAINIDLLCGMLGTSSPEFDLWEAWLETSELGPDAPIYSPYPSGAWDLPGRTAEFRQLHSGLRTEQVVAAVYDGIALGHLRQIRKFLAAGTVSKLVVCGGLTRSAAWCQRLCDYANLPVEVSDDPHSASRGAALCVLTGLGASMGPAKRNRRSYVPDPSRVSKERCDRFLRMIKET